MRLSFDEKTLLALAILAASMAITGPIAFAHDYRDVGGYQFTVGFRDEPAVEGLANGVDLQVDKKAEADDHEHDATMDVAEHGAVFAAPALGPGQTFEFEVTHMLEGLTIPFHNHLNHDMTGAITVGDHGKTGTVEVEIHASAFEPSEITVQSGTVLVFANRAQEPQNVTSGLIDGTGHAQAVVPVEGLEQSLQVEVTHVGSGISKTMPLRAVFGEPGRYTADLIPTASGAYTFRFFGAVEGHQIDEIFESGQGRFSDIEPAVDLHFPLAQPTIREIEGAARGAQSSAEQAEDSASTARTLGIIGIAAGILGTAIGAASVAIAMRPRR